MHPKIINYHMAGKQRISDSRKDEIEKTFCWLKEVKEVKMKRKEKKRKKENIYEISDYVHFRANILGKDKNSLILPPMG